MIESRRRSFVKQLLVGLAMIPAVLLETIEAVAKPHDTKKQAPRVPRKYGIAHPDEKKKRPPKKDGEQPEP
jgi:hypothetical protein